MIQVHDVYLCIKIEFYLLQNIKDIIFSSIILWLILRIHTEFLHILWSSYQSWTLFHNLYDWMPNAVTYKRFKNIFWVECQWLSRQGFQQNAFQLNCAIIPPHKMALKSSVYETSASETRVDCHIYDRLEF